MLITDYSNIAFDFAYMRRPVIYYQNPSVSLQNNISTFSYRESGFGDVVTDADELVEKVISIINSNFKVSAEYLKRRKEFFAFDDRNNCKRIANAIYDFEYNNKVPTADVKGGFGEVKPKPEPQPIAKQASNQEKAEKTIKPVEKKPQPQQQPKKASEHKEAYEEVEHQGIIYSDVPKKQEIGHSEEQKISQKYRPRPTEPPHQSEQYTEKRVQPQRQQTQQIRYAEAPKRQRPAEPPRQPKQHTTERQVQPQRQQTQQIRYAEAPKKQPRPAQPQRSSGARYAEPSQQRNPQKSSEARRVAQSRTTAQRKAPTSQESVKQTTAQPKHADKKSKKSFRIF